jgi:BlaI family transcriptional regulator, penicillinase repressor
MPERVQAAPRHLQRIENRPEPMLDHLPRDKQLSLRDWLAALDVALQHGQRLWKWDRSNTACRLRTLRFAAPCESPDLNQTPFERHRICTPKTGFGCDSVAACPCTDVVVGSPRLVGDMKKARLSKAETRILEQFWEMGTCSVREILESLPEDERVAYTTVQTLVYRLEEKGAVSRVKKIGNAQLFEPAINRSEFRSGLVRDILDLFGGSPRLLVSNLLEAGTLTLRDLKALQSAAPNSKKNRKLGGKGHA